MSRGDSYGVGNGGKMGKKVKLRATKESLSTCIFCIPFFGQKLNLEMSSYGTFSLEKENSFLC